MSRLFFNSSVIATQCSSPAYCEGGGGGVSFAFLRLRNISERRRHARACRAFVRVRTGMEKMVEARRMDTRRDIGGPERSALANSADGYGKRPIKFHSLPSRQMTSDKYAARDPCHRQGEPRREKGTTVYRGLSLIDSRLLPASSTMLIRSVRPGMEHRFRNCRQTAYPPSKPRLV